jgi:DNA-binding CsgD family transcriptional regulator
MVASDRRWHAGINLYRARRGAFSMHERDVLQRLRSPLANTIRNCKLFADTSQTSSLLDAILRQRGYEAVLVSPTGRELARTDGATSLIERWFAPTERDRSGIPHAALKALRETLERGVAQHALELPLPTLGRALPDGSELQVLLTPVPHGSQGLFWALVLQEARWVPEAWRDVLTAKEYDVASLIVRGFDNRSIADTLKCEPATVKKHAQRIFDKLGVPSRAALCHLASRQKA